MTKIILASSSPFRHQILQKLALPFTAITPHCDETPKPTETPKELVERLAIAKAQSLAPSQPNALIIGSDQVATHQQAIIGKPHTRHNAIIQLQKFSGQSITFFTGLCVLDTRNQKYQSCVEPFIVHFRQLTLSQIEYYIDSEQPLNSAGSFKSEGLGISLFTRLQGDDPNTIVGLPLIKLTQFLLNCGVDVLDKQTW